MIQINTIYKLYETAINNNYRSYFFRTPLIQIAISTIRNNGTTVYVLSEKYSVCDVKTIKKFNLPITEEYINLLCTFGKVDTLDYLYKKLNNFSYSSYTLDLASMNGHVNVLEWWLNSGLELKYTSGIDWASWYGHVNVLEWWLNSGLELKYTSGIDGACWNGHINVLEWWKNSGLPLKYTEIGLNHASAYGYINVLEWWKNSALELKYTKYAFIYASYNGYVDVLEWWKNYGIPSDILKKYIV